MKDDPVYTPEDCFETYPLPREFEKNGAVEGAGHDYYEFRENLLRARNEGLTTIYNWFHDPENESVDISRLRELHAAMDRSVLEAYGWSDLRPKCEFLLDYEEEEEETVPRRKKPWRYRWPDEFRDEVLARLLELNRQRAEHELLDGIPNKVKKTGKRGPKNPPAKANGQSLFP
jgi:hypothetical protein